MADDDKKPTLTPKLTAELGTTGLTHYDGYLDEEFHPDLKGDKGKQALREMRDNSPIVGAILFATAKLCRQVPWSFAPSTHPDVSGQEAQDAADFATSCMNGLSQGGWGQHVARALSFLPFGFAPFEKVYYLRNDGMIAVRKLAFRAQETILQWRLADNGDIQGLVQQAPPKYATVEIPAAKLLLYRCDDQGKGNPEGRSILRTAYVSYYRSKRLSEIEAIGMERDLSGFPVLRMPGASMSDKASPEEIAAYSEAKTIVRRIKRNQQEGLILPSDKGPNGEELWSLSLLSTGGRRAIDIDGAINRYDRQIAQSVLADFVMLGHEKVGSFALASSKTDMFAVAIAAYLDDLAEQSDDQLFHELCELNGIRPEAYPTLTHGDIESRDLVELSTYVTNLTNAGLIVPDVGLDRYLRQAAKLPEGEAEA
jgi:hypothetical protein